MQTHIIQIGTSRGIRIPKYLLDKYELEGAAEMNDTGSGILIKPITHSRADWAEAFKMAANTKDDALLELPESEWDSEEWEW